MRTLSSVHIISIHVSQIFRQGRRDLPQQLTWHISKYEYSFLHNTGTDLYLHVYVRGGCKVFSALTGRFTEPMKQLHCLARGGARQAVARVAAWRAEGLSPPELGSVTIFDSFHAMSHVHM
ncbi:hypothetical protein E2C01_042148 [Portunus trituberculatus]|uniref:Uncharacterized protein n=1 Tax=Portunus trituberculatus TaxID=210409 RepID=A0A5B7FSM7_PORTR|nr:hypothetical protein [Portunus trituberculatus]